MADRTCPGCGMNDDHPRHILVDGEGNQRAWHKDCHKLKGCEVCTLELQDVAPGTIGDELREHLVANAEVIAAGASELTTEQLETAHGTGV